MKFNTLKEKCEYYRSLTDYRLIPNSYVLIMVDGRNFSSLIKSKYELPFDETFIDMMNQTAAHLCGCIQGAKFAYTQSDEISILVTDFDTPTTDSVWGFRLSKILPLVASEAATKFTQLMMANDIVKEDPATLNPAEFIKTAKLAEFDCKAWNVPSKNDAFSWFLHRQNDCVRNSKQQAAQTYFPHKQLVGLDSDAQINLLKETKGIDWNTDYNDGMKYGRLIYPETRKMMKRAMINGGLKTIEFERKFWEPHYAQPFNGEGKETIQSLIPNRDGLQD